MTKSFIKHKRIKRYLAVFLLLILTAGLYNSTAFAEPSDTKEKLEEAKKEKQEKEKELQDAKNQLAVTQSGLAALEDTKNTYQGKLNTLNSELQEVADNLAVIEKSMEIKELEIFETTTLLEETTAKREEQYEAMKRRIRFMYESQDFTYIEILASAESFGEFLNYANYIEDLSAYDRRMLDEYVETEKEVAAQKNQLETELTEIEDLKNDAEDEHARVAGLITDTAESLADTAESIDELEDLADAFEDACNEKQKEVAEAEAEYMAIKAQYEEELRLAELARQSAWRDISEVSFDEGDRYLLANLIYCEAGAEPDEGKLAVGAVVINRVLSSRYPDTVTGVIYQAHQFSPVGDGHLSLALANDRATQACYDAADQAMKGATNVGNCLYFRTPIPGLSGKQIGNHIFY